MATAVIQNKGGYEREVLNPSSVLLIMFNIESQCVRKVEKHIPLKKAVIFTIQYLKLKGILSV